ncbi:N-acetyltransferase [uncultured Ramlibacter sp.]|uniref:N-acyl amino acid synthase FeeM domain-containing protein n=1 Tax=uncultured Ramlibacter sp. TaxID=260755 RepID=UPI00261D07EC|nr:N-acetyltransferase [uncultured Ramlibacter sp.]
MTGAFEFRGTLVGTVRVLPMDQGLSPCEQLLGELQPPPMTLDGEASWEVGRLVLAPQFRADPSLLKRCLCLTLVHMIRHTEVKDIFASCTPVLARLYRRFAFSVVVKQAWENTDGAYSLIHGQAREVLLAVAGNEAERRLASGLGEPAAALADCAGQAGAVAEHAPC